MYLRSLIGQYACRMKTKYIILIHALYWFYIINQLLFPMYVGKPEQTGMVTQEYLEDMGISLLLNVITFYLVYFSFPRLAGMRNRTLVAAFSLVLLAALMVIRLGVGWLLWSNISYDPGNPMAFEWIWVWNELRMAVITAIYAILIRFMIHAFEAQKLRNELINQKQAGELALLRSQVNPHFLFNTLNNIYALVYQKSDEAPEAVMKFSSIMRYVLYDTAAESVSLVTEVEYLRSYIELQQLRYKQPGLVELTIDGIASDFHVAPMMLIPIVENAFKHGSMNRSPGIIIRLHAGTSQLRFEVINYLRKNRVPTGKRTAGTGLANLRRRLELTCRGKYQLDAREEGDQFIVDLVIGKCNANAAAGNIPPEVFEASGSVS